MMTPWLVSAALGVIIAGGILILVRRDQMHGSYAVWWLTVAVVALVVGFFPQTIDWLGRRFGVNYPPMLAVLLAITALLLKILALDIDVTRRERRVRRMLQKIAIMEAELRGLRAQIEQRPAPADPMAAAPPDTRQALDETPRQASG